MCRGIAPPYPTSWADPAAACPCGHPLTKADLFDRPADDQLAQVCLGCGWAPRRCSCAPSDTALAAALDGKVELRDVIQHRIVYAVNQQADDEVFWV